MCDSRLFLNSSMDKFRRNLEQLVFRSNSKKL
jgi:hypothetical protein